jgi:hypothetical protein
MRKQEQLQELKYAEYKRMAASKAGWGRDMTIVRLPAARPDQIRLVQVILTIGQCGPDAGTKK